MSEHVDELNEGRTRKIFGHKDRIFNGSFSEDGHFLATASADGDVRAWTMSPVKMAASCAQVLSGHSDEVLRVAFGKGVLASGGADGDVRIWRQNEGKFEGSIVIEGENDDAQVYALSFVGADGSKVMIGRGDCVSVHSISDGRTLSSSRFAPRGAVVGGAYRNPEQECFVFDTACAMEHVFAAALGDGTVRLRDLRSSADNDAIIFQGGGSFAASCQFQPNDFGKLLSTSGQGHVYVGT